MQVSMEPLMSFAVMSLRWFDTLTHTHMQTVRKHLTLLSICDTWQLQQLAITNDSLVTVSTLINPFSNNRYDYWRNVHAVVTSAFWHSDTVVGVVTGWCVFDVCHLALNHWLTEVDVIASSLECLKLLVQYHLMSLHNGCIQNWRC